MANRDFFRRLGLADEVAAPTLAKLRQPKILRRLLLALGPIVVLAGGHVACKVTSWLRTMPRLASAPARAIRNGSWSRVNSTCPLSTFWLSFTATLATMPDTSVATVSLPACT